MSEAIGKPTRPVDGNHALLIGNIAGALMRSEGQPATGVEPVMLGSDYSNQLLVKRQHGTYRVTIERESEEQARERVLAEEASIGSEGFAAKVKRRVRGLTDEELHGAA